MEGERVTCPATVAGGTGGGRRSCVRTYKQTTAGLVIPARPGGDVAGDEEGFGGGNPIRARERESGSV